MVEPPPSKPRIKAKKKVEEPKRDYSVSVPIVYSPAILTTEYGAVSEKSEDSKDFMNWVYKQMPSANQKKLNNAMVRYNTAERGFAEVVKSITKSRETSKTDIKAAKTKAEREALMQKALISAEKYNKLNVDMKSAKQTIDRMLDEANIGPQTTYLHMRKRDLVYDRTFRGRPWAPARNEADRRRNRKTKELTKMLEEFQK